MNCHIKTIIPKEIPFDYMELAKRMWFEERRNRDRIVVCGFLELIPIENFLFI